MQEIDVEIMFRERKGAAYARLTAFLGFSAFVINQWLSDSLLLGFKLETIATALQLLALFSGLLACWYSLRPACKECGSNVWNLSECKTCGQNQSFKHHQ